MTYTGMHVMVTGASGFVGRSLCERLAAAGADVTAASRRAPPDESVRHRVLADLAAESEWTPLVDSATAVVHLAAVTHDGVRRATPEQFERVNVHATPSPAQAAARAGAARFVYMSTIKVNGESTALGDRSDTADPLRPDLAYGRRKLAAQRVRDALGWCPSTPFEVGLQAAAAAYRRSA